jgi:UDP-glucose 4-epimerase
MRRALITGGAGFIGSWLAETLHGRGWSVTVIDDLSTGSAANVGALAAGERFSLVVDTVLDRRLMAQLVDAADVVFHLAAAVGVRLIVEEPVHTIETNVRTTEVVLDLCARQGKPLVMTSSSEVYGKLDRPRFHEDDDLVLGPTSRARWCYAGSKIIDEFLAHAYHVEKGLPVVMARLFNTIGPRQSGRYGMVVPRFVEQALAGEPLTVHGDGSQRRSFTWVGDVVEALIALAAHPQAAGRVFNVGHHEEISILELARLVRRLAESSSEIVFVPYEEVYGQGFEDMVRRLPDTSRIASLIGFKPSVDLPEMLRRILDHARSSAAPRPAALAGS